ncbi:MAG: PAS domain S-box protein [Nostocales cyanobacterium]|nr:MAG: PAS domain S-box protein [Nostocales cyanobacterium]
MQLNDQQFSLKNLNRVIDRHPLTMKPDSHVLDAVILMNQEQSKIRAEISHTSATLPVAKWQQKVTSYVLVVEERQLLGIFTLRDVLRLTALAIDLSKTTMAEVMTQQLITLKQSNFQDISTVLSILQSHGIHHLPIVDDGEELVGIVTESGLLQELDLVNIVGVVESLQQYSPDSTPTFSVSEYNYQQTKEVIKEIKINEELQQTIEELQIVEEEIRQQNEQLVVASEIAELERRRYQNLFEFTPCGYLVTDKFGIVQEANYAASSLLSVEQKFLVGRPLKIFIAEQERHRFISQWRDLPRWQESEFYLQPRNGKPLLASVKVSPMHDSQGQHSGWSWLLSNISHLKQTETALRLATEELENQVAKRTAELVVVNQALQQEIKERKQTEAALRKSEEIFRQFGENIQAQIIWIRSYKNGETLYVNPAYEKIWGRSCQSLWDNPTSWTEPIHPEDRARILAEIKQKGKNIEPSSLQYRLVQMDGSIRWIWARCFPIKNEKGQFDYFGGIAEDITERKLAEDSLRESEARLTLALETANMGIWEQNLITGQCIWSAHLGLLYGFSKGSLCPSSPEDLFKLIYPEDHKVYTQAVNDAIEQASEFAVEYRVIWPDGSLHWLRGTGKVYHDQQGQPIRMIGTTRDISDRKQKEQKLYEQAALLDIATDAIFVRDFQTEILFWNQGAERIYGWQKHEAVGKNLNEIFCSKTTSPQEAIALKTVLKSGCWQGELTKLTKFDQEIIVESRWTLMFDDDQQPKSILIVDTDITEDKRREEQFLRTQRLESLGTLASGIAHDLNNILTPILIAAQLIKGRCAKNPETHPQLLKTIENNAIRGGGLVKQVLSFARGLKGERTIVQVKHLITEIIQIGKQTFSKSIEFSTRIQEDLWTVCGDTTQIHQVLMNLVLNARDAMPNGGLLTIAAENMFIDEAYIRMNIEAKVGSYIVITITDTGMGMSPKTLDRIFEPFFTTKEVGVGTGLGLSTALGIIKSHNGFVTVSSQIDQGTTFKVFLPSVEVSQLPSLEQLEVTSGKGEFILVVDDEPQIRDVTTIILENHNYQTLTASNGIEAIAIYAQHKQEISAVLMDMMMPEMDGIMAIRTLQKMNPEVKIIACSGLGTIELLPQSAETKVQAVLLKPYTANELLQNLNQVIGNS